jgi:hypothetical protein
LEHLLGRVAQGDMTLQSMIFEPSTRTLYLATGSNAPRKSYHRLDLKRYFASGGADIADAADGKLRVGGGLSASNDPSAFHF